MPEENPLSRGEIKCENSYSNETYTYHIWPSFFHWRETEATVMRDKYRILWLVDLLKQEKLTLQGTYECNYILVQTNRNKQIYSIPFAKSTSTSFEKKGAIHNVLKKNKSHTWVEWTSLYILEMEKSNRIFICTPPFLFHNSLVQQDCENDPLGKKIQKRNKKEWHIYNTPNQHFFIA